VGKVKQERYGMYFTAEINKYLREHPERKNMQSDSTEGGSLADMIKNGAEGLHGTDEELSLPQMCDEILTQLGLSADKKPVSEAIKSWLISENYLTEKVENGQKRLAATILSEEAGIIEREKISSLNRTYKTVLFPRVAQEFVFENLNEIL
jgi:ATP-dependent DNA helicase RecQ